ncbi:MAG: TPM domain-containing protein [Candidatus Eremiobacteraeota bacterium]|nr:TPM domain-containing protein [Candidatus Eremiobacteraeota bacterium]
MKSHASKFAAAGAVLLFALAAAPALARDFVQDQGGMFSASTVAQLNARLASFNAQTRKEVVVVTVPSLGGTPLQQAAQSAFAQQNVNGVLIFIARDDRRDIIVPDRAGVQAGWFTPDVLRSIRTSMESQFRSESYDAGITNAVDGVLGIYRSHLGSLQQSAQSGQAGSTALAPVSNATPSRRGTHISMFWWIIIAIVAFLLLRSILRAASGPRYYGAPGAPGAGVPPGGGYGPGYGPGYGGYGGGGSFWSGLLGGLGGAWLGNELFRGGGGAIQGGGAPGTGDSGGGWGGGDGGGWQSDAGQADTGGASGGDWSGGGFGGDSGGGGGDVGGGDFGGGDAGGGW